MVAATTLSFTAFPGHELVTSCHISPKWKQKPGLRISTNTMLLPFKTPDHAGNSVRAMLRSALLGNHLCIIFNKSSATFKHLNIVLFIFIIWKVSHILHP